MVNLIEWQVRFIHNNSDNELKRLQFTASNAIIENIKFNFHLIKQINILFDKISNKT